MLCKISPPQTTSAYQHTGTVNSARAICSWIQSGMYKAPTDCIGDHTYVPLIFEYGGKTVTVHKGDWLVKVGKNLRAYTDKEFHSTFVPLDDLKDLNKPEDLNTVIERSAAVCAYTEGVSHAEADDVVESIQYHHFPGTTQVICLLTLKHGFYIVGEHSSLDHSAFDLSQAQADALNHAKRKLRDHIAYAKRLGSPLTT